MISRNQIKLSGATLTNLASQTVNDDLFEKLKIFYKLDKDKDGYITLKELRDGVKDFENMQELSEIFKDVDADDDRLINYSKFIAATLDQTKYVNAAKRVRDAFNEFIEDRFGLKMKKR